MSVGIEITKLSGMGRGKKESFDRAEVLLGTGGTCDVRFDPAWDKTVDAQHARVVRDASGATWIEDAGSSRGVFVDGKKISRVQFRGQAVIELGKGGPRVEIKAEGGRALPPAVSASPAGQAQSAGAGAGAGRGGGHGAAIGLVAAVVLIGGGFMAWKMIGGDTDDQLRAVAKKYEKAVGVVVLATQDGAQPFATAWAAGPRVFATNSHVAAPAVEMIESGASVFVILNKNPEERYRVTRAVAHPRFMESPVDVDGKEPAVGTYDVGLLYVERDLPVYFPMAAREKLEAIDSGTRVAFLGFPMENLAGGGVNLRYPVATMQSGIVTSTTDYWLGKAPFEERFLIQHNLGATGGASGSPIFDVDGEVIGILSAGNIIGAISFDGTEVHRAPSAVMINFGQRIDLLQALLKDEG